MLTNTTFSPWTSVLYRVPRVILKKNGNQITSFLLGACSSFPWYLVNSSDSCMVSTLRKELMLTSLSSWKSISMAIKTQKKKWIHEWNEKRGYTGKPKILVNFSKNVSQLSSYWWVKKRRSHSSGHTDVPGDKRGAFHGKTSSWPIKSIALKTWSERKVQVQGNWWKNGQ